MCSPAIAIARALADRGHPPASIELVGSERGIETRLVPAAGFELTTLPGRGFERRLSLRNVRSAFSLLVAFGRAWRLVGRRKPRVVLSVGGYASVPCALAAVLRRVPIVVAEQNAAPGAANRLVGRFAEACAVSFEGTPLPRAVVTGNPVRPEVLAIDRVRDAASARTKLDVEPGRTDGARLRRIAGGPADQPGGARCRPRAGRRGTTCTCATWSARVTGRRSPRTARPSPRTPPFGTRPWSTTTTCRPRWRRPTSPSAARGRAPASSCWPWACRRCWCRRRS